MDLQPILLVALAAAIGAAVTALISRRMVRIQFAEDLVEGLVRVRREWAAFLEDAGAVLEQTEAKRHQIQLERARIERGAKPNDPEPEPVPMDITQERALAKRGIGGAGWGQNA